jgi:hypothetical protein
LSHDAATIPRAALRLLLCKHVCGDDRHALRRRRHAQRGVDRGDTDSWPPSAAKLSLPRELVMRLRRLRLPASGSSVGALRGRSPLADAAVLLIITLPLRRAE